MTIPYDYDQTNIEHLRAVIDEQERTIKYLHERCKAEEVENAKLREQIASFRELSQDMVIFAGTIMVRHFARRLRELGVEVDE